MYEPRWSTLHFDEGEKEQGKRDIFDEVRMDANFTLQRTSPRVPIAAFACRRARMTCADKAR